MSRYDDPLAGDPARDDKLVLVDGLDREVGTATKLQAHVEGLLHRAFSVVLVRDGQDGYELTDEELEAVSGGEWVKRCNDNTCPYNSPMR